MTTKKKLALASLVFLMVIQLFGVDRSTPTTEPGQELLAPEKVSKILRKSCYDCHSYHTEWPAYSRAAPLSWWVADHVVEGREHLNFSIWESYTPEEKKEFLEEIAEEVEEGKMPLPSYLLIHRDARLTETERSTLEAWATEGRLHD